jgi:hypothetical protein
LAPSWVFDSPIRALTLRVFSHETPSLSTQAPPLVPYKSTLLASDLQNASGSNLNTRPCNPAVMAVLTQMLLGFCPVRILSCEDFILLGFGPARISSVWESSGPTTGGNNRNNPAGESAVASHV